MIRPSAGKLLIIPSVIVREYPPLKEG